MTVIKTKDELAEFIKSFKDLNEGRLTVITHDKVVSIYPVDKQGQAIHYLADLHTQSIFNYAHFPVIVDFVTHYSITQ